MDLNNFDQTVGALFGGMNQVFSTKTVVGDVQKVGDDTIIVPLVDVSFGMGAGAFSKEKGNSGAGGVGAKMTPSAILVIQNGQSRLISVKSQDMVTKLFDMVPPTVDKVAELIQGRGKGAEKDPVVEAAIDENKKAEAVREEL